MSESKVPDREATQSFRFRVVINLLLIAIAILPAIGIARSYLTQFARPGDAVEPFTDAMTYLASGERLNAGHHLYSLDAVDRPVYLFPPGLTVPLLSPPPIAALWRPLAAIPAGFALWIVLCWSSLLGTVAYLVIRIGWPMAIVCVLMSQPIGEQLAVANMAALFPGAMVLAWRWRDRPASGILGGAMAVFKLIPGTLIGWYIGHRPAAFLWAVAGGIVIAAATLALVGPAEFFDYLRVMGVNGASPESLAVALGLPWLSYAILIGGTIAAAMIRSDAVAFVVAILAAVTGNPALYGASLVPLLATFAPLIPDPGGPTAYGGMPRTREGLPTGTTTGDHDPVPVRP